MYDQQDTVIEGVVGTIIFRNEANGYTVMELECEDELITAVCNAPILGVGERVQLTGSWTVHRDYGQQFKADTCIPMMPETTEQMERFLASGLIRGVGPSTARSIVAHFGEHTAEVLEYAPHRLVEVPGIGSKTALKIAESYAENMHMRTVIAGLGAYGISVPQALRIAAQYGAEAVQKVRENPYRLAEDVLGIGFKTADAIARDMGVEPDSPYRIAAALKYYLQWSSNEGHMYVPSQTLVQETANGIGVEADRVEMQAARMVMDGELVLAKGEEEPVYLPVFYYAEQECARRLISMLRTQPKPLNTDAAASLAQQEKLWQLTLAPMQKEALLLAANGPVTVITGGPGTGKTTIVKFLISVLERSGVEYALCAPTGRAAKRMREATDRDASTIHRLLEYGGGEQEGELRFGRDQDRPLEAKAIIVDEMSMVDIFLFMRLLRAVPKGARLILIGDADQLPSVGAGNVLRDILRAGTVPSVALDVVYRQGEGSAISRNAHRINNGELPVPTEGEFEIRVCENATQMWQEIASVSQSRDVQVIAPMKKGEFGVLGLNEKLQRLQNPPAPYKPELQAMGRTFRQGDKVMQMKNDYQMEWTRDVDGNYEEGVGVFNGEMGSILEMDPRVREMTVALDDDRLSVYTMGDAQELELAYAITVHKSQGSEFDCVVLVLAGGAPMLFTRNLLYTAVTRAKKRVVIIGRRGAVSQMIQNNRTRTRYSGLAQAMEEMMG